MRITSDSHVDHALTQVHLDFIQGQFGDRQAFFLQTVELPEDLPPLPCGLHGPVMGDEPVADSETTSVVRGGRKGPSRVCNRPTRMVRTMTVIGGPDDSGEMILYTAYGGPSAPREPWDPALNEEQRAQTQQFWSKHALSLA